MENNQNQINSQSNIDGQQLGSRLSFPSYQSISNVEIQTQKNEKNINQAENQFEKIQNKRSDINEDEILKMFMQQGGNNTKQDQEIQLNKKPSKKLKRQNSESQTLNRRESTGKAQTKQIKQDKLKTKQIKFQSATINNLLNEFKIQYRASIYDNSWQQVRYKFQQQFFIQLCVGIEELKQKSSTQLTLSQQTVLKKIQEYNSIRANPYFDFGIFKYCKNLVLQIDVDMFLHFHKKKMPLNQQYKVQWTLINNYISDSLNSELRSKILTRQLLPEKIKTSDESQFYTKAKKAEIKLKQQKLLAQFSSQGNKMTETFMNNQQNQNQIVSQQPFANQNSINKYQKDEQKQSDNLSKQAFSSKYLQEGTFGFLQQLLSKNHLLKMKDRIQQDLKDDVRVRVLAHMDKLIQKA